ncbi:hypothetical protein [Burkholderia sp. MSMB1589WGS]|uniref:hypothetical protein n=1 Tax=Burkholderia sp. MSMB1589WGS TaxID=1636425 RepID=UPI0012E7BB84|nr:hypothetical protein [Burkholderia sp. MSMB1589WGS]
MIGIPIARSASGLRVVTLAPAPGMQKSVGARRAVCRERLRDAPPRLLRVRRLAQHARHVECIAEPLRTSDTARSGDVSLPA